MSPTLTIPGVAPPARSSGPAGNAAADGEDGAAFADALQRAQGGHKPTQGHEPRSATPRGADAQARTTRSAPAGEPACDGAAPTAGDAALHDAAAVDAGDPSADAAPHAAAPGDTSLTPQSPLIVIEPALTAPAVGDPHREPRARTDADTDTDDAALAIDERPSPGRPGGRAVGAHDLRAGPAVAGHAARADEARGRDGAPAWSFHAEVERAAVDTATASTATLRTPAFERAAAEPSATPLAAAPALRDAAASAPGLDAKLPQASLHAGIDDADFGAALGTQVSLWVREGVQEARLQLHPAELGPVTVQIALEGQAAHVDFTAAVAATRESIEQSLPALAAALRESGFTLTGGGVASHGGQGGSGDGRRERAAAGRGDSSRSEGAEAGRAAGAPRRWTRSLLDVYA